MNNRNIKSTRI